MGYDFSWAECPPEIHHDIAEACRQFDAAVEVRNARYPEAVPEGAPEQEEVRRRFDAIAAARVNVFHLDIAGMDAVCRELLGVGLFSDIDHDPWPTPPAGSDAALGAAEKAGDGWVSTRPLTPEEVAYLEETERILRGVPGDHPGIPRYKVGSNDGWHITTGEIRVTLAWLDHRDPGWRDHLTERSREFVAFLETAAEHGGCSVH